MAVLKHCLFALAVACLCLRASDAYATSTVSDWVPAWLPTANMASNSTWHPLAQDVQLNCNSVDFATDPSLGDLYVGRRMNGACGTGSWSLIWGRIDWMNDTINYAGSLLDTSTGPVPISNNNQVTAAFDPSIVWWHNEWWVAFECGTTISSGSCIGPLRGDGNIDLTRTALVVKYGGGGNTVYSASVPKLFVFQDQLYVYYTAVQIALPAGTFTKLTVRGVQLRQEPNRLRRVFAVGHSGQAIASTDPDTTEVMGLDPNDPTADTSADMTQVMSDGDWIYFLGTRGGSGCVNPLDPQPGCYRLTIGRTRDPLARDTFNRHLMPDAYLPQNPSGYSHFVMRPQDGKTLLMVGGAQSVPSLPNAPAYVTMYFEWPDDLFPARNYKYERWILGEEH